MEKDCSVLNMAPVSKTQPNAQSVTSAHAQKSDLRKLFRHLPKFGEWFEFQAALDPVPDGRPKTPDWRFRFE